MSTDSTTMNTEQVINPFPRNPAEVLTIQDELMDIKGTGLMSDIIRHGAANHLTGTLQFIKDKGSENRPYMVEIIGERLLSQIENL